VSTHGLLVGAALALAGLLVLTVAATYGHSAFGTLRARLLAGRIAAARRAIAVVADTGELTPEGATALRRLPFGTRVDVIAGVAPSLAGEPRAALTAAAREAGLIAGAESGCASRRWRRRFRSGTAADRPRRRRRGRPAAPLRPSHRGAHAGGAVGGRAPDA